MRTLLKWGKSEKPEFVQLFVSREECWRVGLLFLNRVCIGSAASLHLGDQDDDHIESNQHKGDEHWEKEIEGLRRSSDDEKRKKTSVWEEEEEEEEKRSEFAWEREKEWERGREYERSKAPVSGDDAAEAEEGAESSEEENDEPMTRTEIAAALEDIDGQDDFDDGGDDGGEEQEDHESNVESHETGSVVTSESDDGGHDVNEKDDNVREGEGHDTLLCGCNHFREWHVGLWEGERGESAFVFLLCVVVVLVVGLRRRR